MMRTRELVLAIGLCVAAPFVPLQTARATIAIEPAVSGPVTAILGGEQIVVGGKAYAVELVALSELRTVHVGDYVDLFLNGPANSSLSKVIGITVHRAGR